MEKMMKTLGIIGFGAFGALAAEHLRSRFEVVASDRRDKSALAVSMGVRWASITDASACDVVLLCVPISEMEAVLERIKGSVKPGALFVDTCSVKSLPCRLMRRILPRGVEVLASHPLFGPQSACRGLDGLEIVLCPVRVTRKTLAAAKKVLREMGLRVSVMLPREHDRRIAETQAVAHFIAAALKGRIPAKRLRVASFEKLADAMELVRHDSPRLFRDMQQLNPFAAAERKLLLKRLEKIDGELNGVA